MPWLTPDAKRGRSKSLQTGNLELTRGSYGILTPAYRTPPVRGEDRVHLREFLNSKVLANLLFARVADQGMTPKEVRHGS